MRKAVLQTFDDETTCDYWWGKYARMLTDLEQTARWDIRKEKRRGVYYLSLIEREEGNAEEGIPDMR